MTFIGAAFLTTLLALDYRPSGNPGEFYALILFSTAGMNFMAASSELIMAYVSLELSSISLYILAGYFRNDKLSSEAGLKYFLFGALSSGILLYGMSLAYGFTASMNRAAGGQPIIGTLFSEIAKAGTAAQGGAALLTLAMIFVVAGIGYKVAVVPFHSWSPDVYQGAPTPITAFISTASKTAGFILLYRVLAAAFPSIAGSPSLTSFGGWTSLLALIALATMLVGNLSALPQKNAKRLLAYSSIGHAGFLLLALVLWGSASPADKAFSTSSLVYYLIAYTATNLGAFGALAVIARGARRRRYGRPEWPLAAQHRPDPDADGPGAVAGRGAAAVGLLGQVLRVHGRLQGRRGLAGRYRRGDDDRQPVLLPGLPEGHVDERAEVARPGAHAADDERDPDRRDGAGAAAGPVPERDLGHSGPGGAGGRKESVFRYYAVTTARVRRRRYRSMNANLTNPR